MIDYSGTLEWTAYDADDNEITFDIEFEIEIEEETRWEPGSVCIELKSEYLDLLDKYDIREIEEEAMSEYKDFIEDGGW